MIPGQGWTPPPGTPGPLPPPGPPSAAGPQPRRYATKGIWIGIVLGIVVTIALSALAIGIGIAISQHAAVGWVLFLLAASTPLAAGILLTAREGSPSRRGLGLGLIIGWALAPIVFGGACVLIVLGAYTVPGFPGGVA